MKQKLCLILTAIIFLSLLICNQSLAVTPTDDYTIQSYDINMIVNEDNTFEITENIAVYFNVEKHGIYRKIPLRNTVRRMDGTKSNNMAKITDISVSEKYTIGYEDQYKVIKIGDEDQELIGPHTYTIKYKYDIGRDPLKDADELYFNLIGDQWDASIYNVNFSITMPKSFDESLLGFSSGYTGSTDSYNVIYTVDGNTINGSTLGALDSGEALTVRLTLPEGYFVRENKIDGYPMFIIAICAILVLIADHFWRKYGKDEPVIETVEFYPPEGLNSAEVQFLYDGSVGTEGVISLLVYLANQGYLKIEETEEKGLLSKSKGNFKITKVKEYDGNNECEKLFFEGLFKGTSVKTWDLKEAKRIRQEAKERNEKISYSQSLKMTEKEETSKKDSVTGSDLYNSFYNTLNKIKTKMNSKENKNRIFEATAGSKIKYIILMILAIFLLITVKPMLEYDMVTMLVVLLMLQRNGTYNVNCRTFFKKKI